MSRSVAFLRAINVGGRRVTKDELIGCFVDQGYEDVETFLASGNVLFGPGPPLSEADIGEALGRHLGYEVPTTVRTKAELESLAALEPFPSAALAASAGKPQVILLFDGLSKAAESAVRQRSCADDLLVPAERAVHWLPSGGVSGTGLEQPELQKLVGLNTVRTLNTIGRLIPKL